MQPNWSNGQRSESEVRLGGLRTVPPPQFDTQGQGDSGLAVRQVRKDGQQLVTLQYVRRANEWVVEALVYPAGSMRVEPVAAGPYAFGSLRQAELFLDEVTLALEYLGCEVT